MRGILDGYHRDGIVFGRRRRWADLVVSVLAVLCLAAGLAITGCFAGVDPHAIVQTSAGPTEAGTLWNQDTAGDLLKAVKTVQAAAVAYHDGRATTEDTTVHAKRRTLLLATAKGIQTGYDGLIRWKQGISGTGPDDVLLPLRPLAKDLLDLASITGALNPDQLALLQRLLGGGA